MALRYVAVSTRNEELPRMAPWQSAGTLSAVFETKCLKLFTNEDAILLPGNKGAVIGHLFTRTVPAKRVHELDETAGREILSSRGEALLSKYWGGYVAFLVEDAGTTVIRDPSGALPCYFTQDAGRLTFSSDIEGLLQYGIPAPHVDWDGLFLHLAALDFKRPRTALAGIGELLAGFRLRTRDPGNAEATWSPWAFIQPSGLSDTEAAHRVKEAVASSTSAWASCFNTIGVSLSGGLDSSIVVAALRDQADRLFLLNMAADDAEGDERHSARLAAEAVGSRMTEVFYDPADVDFTRSTSSYLPRPVYSALAMADIGIKARLGAAHALEAWMSGLGGDNVFCIMNSVVPILDQLHVQGFNLQTLKTFQDGLQLTRWSIPEVLRESRHRHAEYKGRYNWTADTAFLNPARMDFAAIPFDHPWLLAPDGAPMGKAQHVASLLRIQGSIDGFHRSSAPLINPLLSQPIMEACLSISSWQWCSGGRNRSIARQAFSDILPPRLLNRRSKGGPNGFSYRLMNANRTVLRDLLLEGHLTENGIVDQNVIAALFKDDMPLSINSCFHLAYLAEAETWCRYWQASARSHSPVPSPAIVSRSSSSSPP